MTRNINKDPASIVEYIKNHSSAKVKVAISDIDGILCGKYIHKDKFLSVIEGGFSFCDVIFGWDTHDLSYEGIDYTGTHTGYPDAQAQIDLTTFREVPWDNNVPFFLAEFEGRAAKVCPRNVLKRIVEKASDMGYRVMAAKEYEFFNFEESPNSLAEKGYQNPKPITPGMFGYSILRASRRHEYFNALFDELYQFDVPIEGLHTETGPGVYEAAILYSDLMEAGDRAVLFKTGVKEIAMRHNIIPTFMAKFSSDLPGSSGHIHQSLWNEAGSNVFYDEDRPFAMSELLESYIAGQLYCLPELLPMYAPNVNSYKRFVEGAWAPTTLTWGVDNRTTAVRVLTGSAKAARIETRVAGADTNPYLSLAAAVASGLYGIEQNMKLTIPRTEGNGCSDTSQGTLPRTLIDATRKMSGSELANSFFGETFVRHFTQTREWEWEQHLKSVTDWELQRYFEII